MKFSLHLLFSDFGWYRLCIIFTRDISLHLNHYFINVSFYFFIHNVCFSVQLILFWEEGLGKAVNNKEHIPVGFTKVMTLFLHRARCALVNLFYGFGRLTKMTKSIKIRFIRKYTHKKYNRWWAMCNEKMLFTENHYNVSDILF